MDIDLLQWPAMVLTIAAAWLVASADGPRRHAGFWIFLASNAAWTAWGIAAQAWGLVILQAFLAVMNVRGLRESPSPAKSQGASTRAAAASKH